MPAQCKRPSLPADVPDTRLQQLRPDLFPGERRQLRQQWSLEQPFLVLAATAESMPPPPSRPPQRQRQQGEQQPSQQQRQAPPALGQGSGSGVLDAAGAQAQPSRPVGSRDGAGQAAALAFAPSAAQDFLQVPG